MIDSPEIEPQGVTSDSSFFSLLHVLIDTLMVDSSEWGWGTGNACFCSFQGTSNFVLQNMLFSG